MRVGAGEAGRQREEKRGAEEMKPLAVVGMREKTERERGREGNPDTNINIG